MVRNVETRMTLKAESRVRELESVVYRFPTIAPKHMSMEIREKDNFNIWYAPKHG